MDQKEEVIETPIVETQPPATTIDELTRQVLAENEARRVAAENRARELEDRLLAVTQPKVVEPTPAPVDDNAFWQRPAANIQEMISAQVAPINEFVESQKKAALYESLKRQYRAQYPAFVQIEALVDRYMQGKEINHANIQSAVREAVGELALSNPALLNQNNPAPATPAAPATVQNTPVVTPPHLRPSVANTQKEETPKQRQLTELERRLAREYKMTDEEYLNNLQAPSHVDGWRKPK